MNINFYEFLKTQVNRDDPIGDFAADTMDLKDARNLSNNKGYWESFLILNHACPESKRAFNQAWKEYSQLINS